MNKNLLALICLLWVGVAYGQNRPIKGKVTAEEDGSILPGISVLVKGTSSGTTTDSDGNYSISAPAGGTLVFSFVGMFTQETDAQSPKIIPFFPMNVS